MSLTESDSLPRRVPPTNGESHPTTESETRGEGHPPSESDPHGEGHSRSFTITESDLILSERHSRSDAHTAKGRACELFTC